MHLGQFQAQRRRTLVLDWQQYAHEPMLQGHALLLREALRLVDWEKESETWQTIKAASTYMI